MALRTFEYSKAEQRMFTELGYADIMSEIEPVNLYKLAALSAFMDDTTGPAVNALRRGVHALVNSKVYRMTPAFDAMIDYEVQFN